MSGGLGLVPFKHAARGRSLFHQSWCVPGGRIKAHAASRLRCLATTRGKLLDLSEVVGNNDRSINANPETVNPRTYRWEKKRQRPQRNHRPAISMGNLLAPRGILFDPEGSPTLGSILLRDACQCSQCIDQSTRQREFLFADIPTNIKAVSQGLDDNGNWTVSWENDIPGYQHHTSKFSREQVKELGIGHLTPGEDILATAPAEAWTKASIEQDLTSMPHAEFMSDDVALARVLRGLNRDGLVFLSEVPAEKDAVSAIVQRIGPLRNTFYGETWDVRSIVNANNVAYTNKHLGFHQDLLYMAYPPAFQFLHCLENSCSGGESRFVDTWAAMNRLLEEHSEYKRPLENTEVFFHYENNGYHYKSGSRILLPRKIRRGGKSFPMVHWSPPFMSRIGGSLSGEPTPEFINASKAFADTLERDDLVFTTKMEEGTCVIFDNLRVLHARNAFDTSGGSRWLRGAYMDRTDFHSKMKQLGPEIEKLRN